MLSPGGLRLPVSESQQQIEVHWRRVPRNVTKGSCRITWLVYERVVALSAKDGNVEFQDLPVVRNPLKCIQVVTLHIASRVNEADRPNLRYRPARDA